MRLTDLKHGELYLCYRDGHPSVLLRWDASCYLFAPSLASRLEDCFPTDQFDGVVRVDEAIKEMGRKFKMGVSDGTH